MKHLVAFTLASLLTAPAFAGGLNTAIEEPALAPPVFVEPARADGDWTGFYAGAQLGYGDVDSDGAGSDGDGALGGLHAGYRQDFGNFVGGVEFDFDLSQIDLGATDELDNITRLKLLGGYDFGRTLVYGTVGAAYANATIAGVDGSDDGYFFGVGADYQLNDKWTIGGEIVQNRFDDFDGTGTDIEAVTAKLKVGLRF
ncbi:MAG: opacity protein-like surface antigen [Pseudorhodobacter sp.]|jgi:outer membrane immunogenic protein